MKNIIKSISLTLITLIAGGYALMACSGGESANNSEEDEKPLVVVSIPPMATLVDSLAQGKVKVVSIINSGANPETFELSMAQRMELENADAILILDVFPFEEILKRDESCNKKIFPVTDKIYPLYTTHSHSHEEGKKHGIVDPHFWSSVENMRRINNDISDLLITLLPKEEKFFKERLTITDAQMSDFAEELRVRLSKTDAPPFMMWHPSLGYFAHDYGLDWMALEIDNKEVSAQRLKRAIDKAHHNGVKLIFTQKELDNRQTLTIAEEIGARTVAVNLLNPDWQYELKRVTDAIVASAPAGN